MNGIVSLTTQFASMVGVAALIAAIINVGKTLGIVADGSSDKWAAGLSLLAFGLIVALGIFRPDLVLADLDQQSGQIATVLLFVAGLLAQTGLTGWAHGIIKGLPIIGKSFSNE